MQRPSLLAFWLCGLCGLCQTDNLTYAHVRANGKPTVPRPRAHKPAPTSGTRAPRATRILAVRASEADNSTRLHVELDGKTRVTPTLQGAGRHWTLVLRGTVPAPELATRIARGGGVRRIGVEPISGAEPIARIQLELNTPVLAKLDSTTSSREVCVQFVPEQSTDTYRSLVQATAPDRYDIHASQADVAAVLTALARESGSSLIVVSGGTTRVTLNLKGVSLAEAVTLLAQAAGCVSRHRGDVYLVGTEKDLAEPLPQPPPVQPPAPPVLCQEIYQCRHVAAVELVQTLSRVFEKEPIRIVLGAGGASPRINPTSTAAVTGVQANLIAGNGVLNGSPVNGNQNITPYNDSLGAGAPNAAANNNANSVIRTLILAGEEPIVQRALALARQLDVRRPQVRINVRITDINSDALRELGVRWNWSNYSAREIPNVLPQNGADNTNANNGQTPLVNGINFGRFGHTPTFVEATLSALEKDDRAKLLAAPTLSLLDGEQGFILSGDRLVFPVLTGFTQAQTPIFSKTEERVGIYLQVAAQVADNGEMVLTLYPQVSVVTNFLIVNGASYPQISTREQQTTIRVRDGDVVVVGGLIREEEVNNVQRVPLLSKIPFFGELFTYRKKQRRKSELVILLIPELIKD